MYYDKSQPYQVLTKIIFIRHGRTDYNDKHLADGAGKAQLSHLGKQQAQFIANKYKNEKISAIYSSPLQRCQDMVKPLAQIIDKDIITDNRIIEHQSPALQDQPFNCATIKRNDEAIDGQDGESIKDVYHRVKVFLEEIIYKHAGQTVVVCSHGDPLVLMRKVLKDFDYNKEKYKNYSDNKEGADPSFVSYIMQYESEIK